MGYSPWDSKESDTTELLSIKTHKYDIAHIINYVSLITFKVSIIISLFQIRNMRFEKVR